MGASGSRDGEEGQQCGRETGQHERPAGPVTGVVCGHGGLLVPSRSVGHRSSVRTARELGLGGSRKAQRGAKSPKRPRAWPVRRTARLSMLSFSAGRIAEGSDRSCCSHDNRPLFAPAHTSPPSCNNGRNGIRNGVRFRYRASGGVIGARVGNGLSPSAPVRDRPVNCTLELRSGFRIRRLGPSGPGGRPERTGRL